MKFIVVLFIQLTLLSFGQNDSIRIIKMSDSYSIYYQDIKSNDSLKDAISGIVLWLNLMKSNDSLYCENLKNTALVYTIQLDDSQSFYNSNVMSCESCEDFNAIFIEELKKLNRPYYHHINDEIIKNEFKIILVFDEKGYIILSDVY